MPKADSLKEIQRLSKAGRVVWKKHALRRLLERGITREAVFHAIETGDIIESYLHDKPLPSFLLLGYDKVKPLHVVVALDEQNDFLCLITVYMPNREEWKEGFKTRRNK